MMHVSNLWDQRYVIVNILGEKNGKHIGDFDPKYSDLSTRK
jgi:hypothetical protein